MDSTIPKLLKRVAKAHPDLAAQYYRSESGDFLPVTYRELYATTLDVASALLSLSHSRGDRVGIIADNRKEWFQSSMAIMAIGAADVPRGCDATTKEISYILSFSGCKSAFLENDAQAQKLLETRDAYTELKTLVFYDAPSDDTRKALLAAGFDVHDFPRFLEIGREWATSHPGAAEAELDKGATDELATLIFTSGTTGEPKGVMLTHDNFLSQLPDLSTRITLSPGDKALSVLPVWHSFERLCEYVMLDNATSIVYSKPIGSVLLADFAKTNPQLFPSVPRIWESVHDGIYRAMRKTGGVTWILFNFFVDLAKFHSRSVRAVNGRYPWFSYTDRITAFCLGLIPAVLLWPLRALGDLIVFRKIRAKLGNAFTEGVSGGGALPPNIDEFFWAVGVKVVEGYGLTETAPVVSVRPFTRPVFGTIGKPLDCNEVKIVDESGAVLPPGVKGTVMVRGRNVMRGYYRKPDLTAKVLSEDGWLDTGDLGLKTYRGEIILRGRKKDTIVLRGGENIEPAPIEMKINESRYVAQSVVLGQDQRYLGALIVVNKDELAAWARENTLDSSDFEAFLDSEPVRRLYELEIAELVSSKTGFKLFERINRLELLAKPFEIGVELSAKQEIMRYKLDSLYPDRIKRLFA